MTLSENWLDAVRKAIRDFIVMPDDEPVDIVVLAAFLFAHLPERQVSVWLNVIMPPYEMETELINLIAGHASVWPLPDRLTAGYFVNQRARKSGALFRIEESGKTVLVARNLATLTELPYQFQCDIYTQLLSIYNGHFRSEAWMESTPLEWGPKEPKDRLGWIGAGTERFYKFLSRVRDLGNPFLLYYMDPARYAHWSNSTDIDEVFRRQPNMAENRRVAKDLVQRFLSSAIAELASFEDVKISAEQTGRLTAAATLASRISERRGGGESSKVDRIRELCRMFGFMAGYNRVSESDVDLGIRIVFSQLAPDVHRIVEFIVDPQNLVKPWPIGELLERVELTRKIASPILERLRRLEVIRRARSGKDASHVYAATEHTIKLTNTFAAHSDFDNRGSSRADSASPDKTAPATSSQ